MYIVTFLKKQKKKQKKSFALLSITNNRMEKKKYGFVTMTFDCCHQGHFELLRGCKMRCDHLIVGLTTDERAQVEKRQTILTYEQRFAILSNCKWVDEVVPNHGVSKETAYEQLRFDILFSGDDYFHSTEFETFSKAYPDVEIVFFPRHLTRSSSDYIRALMERFYKSQTIIAPSIYGYIFRQGYGKPYHVTKCIPFSRLEVRSEFASDDVFGFYYFFDELPRNWKSPSQSQKPQFPMIAGIHANRELLINKYFQHKPWCTYLSHSTVYEHAVSDFSAFPANNPEHKSLLDFANYVARERNMPAKIVQIVQRDAGITMEEWCKDVCKSREEFDRVVNYVQDEIITCLMHAYVVHSDIHPRNVLIDLKTQQVSLIDFGWVTATLFELSPKERSATYKMLEDDFDRKHFRKSLRLSPHTRKWMQQVSVHV